MSNVQAALRSFQEVVGRDNTIIDDPDLQRYGWCTTPVRKRILAAVRPANIEEIQRILAIASQYGIPLYPISTGNNWGYSDSQPARDDTVILDLGRLNRIVEVNADLAYAVVEPGVTQQQLFDYLNERRLPLWLNPTGAGPSCSILGNTLERGFGIGPGGDHFLSQCGMEVILASGEILRTGFGHYPGAKAGHVYKWGTGPYLDGIFTQSNFGVVTKIGVWLTPAPEHFEACYFTCFSEEQLAPLVDATRQLQFWHVFEGPINILHRNRLLIMMSRFPWQEANGVTPLSESLAQRMASERRIGAWNGVGAIYGSHAQVQAAKRTIKRVLKDKVDRISFVSENKLRWIGVHPGLASILLGANVPELLHALRSSFGMLKGIPSEVALPLAYWRNKQPIASTTERNPARDRCGILWFAPVIPMTAKDVLEFRDVIRPVFAKYKFEACMTLTALNERCLDCTLPILFDRDNTQEVESAQACYAELAHECAEHGYFSYRLGLQSMAAEVGRPDVFWDVVSRIKSALDPAGILAPGRYAR